MTKPSLRRTASAHAVLLSLLAATIAALALSGTAAAATSCGNAVLADWFDNGRVDRLYDLHCYEDAIDAIPTDFRDYSNAEEVIARAFRAASGGRLLTSKRQETSPNDQPPIAVPPVDASAPSTIPLPLLVLAGMSFALLAAGGLGYVSRRRRSQTDDPGDNDLHI